MARAKLITNRPVKRKKKTRQGLGRGTKYSTRINSKRFKNAIFDFNTKRNLITNFLSIFIQYLFLLTSTIFISPIEENIFSFIKY